MDAIWALIGVAVGLILGGGLAWMILKQKFVADLAVANQEATKQKDELDRLEKQLAETTTRLTEKTEAYHQLDVTHNQYVAKQEERELAHRERVKELEQFEANLKEAFENLSNAALKKSAEDLVKQAEEVLKRYKENAEGNLQKSRKEIETLLEPMERELKRLEAVSRELNEERLKDATELKTQIVRLQTGTSKLITALQGGGTGGQWGEVALRRIVEMAGLRDKVDFSTQESISTEEGKQRPDMTVYLPGDRVIVIDSKAPVQDLDRLEAEDEDERKQIANAHAASLLKYAKDLHKKEYSKIETAPDFTVMFIASESAFRMAIEGKPDLVEKAMEFNVVVTTPATLLALLRTVAYAWNQERLAKEARTIQKTGKDLYDALMILKTNYDSLGSKLKSTVDAYNKFGGTLDGNVAPKVRRLKESGLPVTAEFEDSNLIDADIKELKAVDFRELPNKALVSDEVESEASLESLD
ncbi:DNA recombination protein RmuC [Kamptonema cortianum]|nr:DNA recombination protein RmuC [Geitlerinema splendidum]MDK3162463.1 DNA recombination protein RmuC [Kamptonema cortianum]